MIEKRTYFLGTHAAELDRLNVQSNTWKKETETVWRLMGIRPGSNVVDLGCGPGFGTIGLAELTGPEGEVIAIDISSNFLSVLERELSTRSVSNVQIMQLDVANESIPVNRMDFVFARWLHQYVDNLDDVVAKEVACLRPGGKLGYIEVFNFGGTALAPRSAIFDLVTDRIATFYADNGRDVSVGADLPVILEKCGASIDTIVNLTPIARYGDPHWEWYRQFSFSLLQRLVDAGLLADDEREAYESEWHSYSNLDGAFLAAPSHVGIIARKR